MKRIDFLRLIADLFRYQTVCDQQGNEFVLLANSRAVLTCDIDDKTEFEAIENHVHIIDHVKAEDFQQLLAIGSALGKAVLCSLEQAYPQRQFIVFLSVKVHDSMIIRFHQKWKDEEPYYTPSDFESPWERVLAFETESR